MQKISYGELEKKLANLGLIFKTIIDRAREAYIRRLGKKETERKEKNTSYRAFHKLPQKYTANHATFPIQM